MTRLRFVAGLAAALMVIAGCAGESGLPEATGKGTIRAINAAKGSPVVNFLIEERGLDAMPYKSESAGRQWDDFEYNFNFEAVLAGDAQPTRIATEVTKIDANRDYTFVFTGSVTAPSILLWEADRATFDQNETIFESRLAHLAEGLGELDFYFDAPGIAPVLGAARGTLAYGEILPPIQTEAGDYVLTVTAAGDPSDVVYQSRDVRYGERNAFVIPLFQGDELDVAPYTARSFNATGGTILMPDRRFPPTVRLFQASIDLAVADVFTDEALTDLLVAGHAFGDVTGDLPAAIGDSALFYTPAGNVGAILFEAALRTIVAGSRTNFIVFGTGTTRTSVTFNPDRRSISTIARLATFHAASNHEVLDLHVVDRGESVSDTSRRTTLGFGFAPVTLALAAGSYDIYLTDPGETSIVAGPAALDVSLGDFVEAIILDVTDPASAEFRIVPAP